jgi:hypothetical protein
MKKTILILLVAAMLLSAASCSTGRNTSGDTTAETTTEETTSVSNTVDEMKLSDIMTKILDKVANLPEIWDIELTSENFHSYAFVDYKDGYEGLCSEAMINACPHSVVLIRVPDSEDASAVAQSMRDNADPQKWICVGAEKVIVRQYGKTILLIMSFTQIANQIVTNFDTLNGEKTPAEDTYVPETTGAGDNTDGDAITEAPIN